MWKFCGDKTIKTDEETAKVLNRFFSINVSSLNIPQYNQVGLTPGKINNPVIKAFLMYRTHLSVNATKENCTSSSLFNLSLLKKKLFLKRLTFCNQINQQKIPTSLLNVCKDGADIFADFVFLNLDNCIEQSVFPSVVKLTNIVPVHKKHLINLKDGYRPCSV